MKLHTTASLERPLSPRAAAAVDALRAVQPGPEMQRVVTGIVDDLRTKYEAQLASARPVFCWRLLPFVGKLGAAYLTDTRKHHAALQAALEGASAANIYLEANYTRAAEDVSAAGGTDDAAMARYRAWGRQGGALATALEACERVNVPMETAPLGKVWMDAFDIKKVAAHSRWRSWT